MRGGNFVRLLERHGQTVEILRTGGGTGQVVRAFLQRVLERREDWVQREPTALGVVRRDRFLYLGPPEADVRDCSILWRGTQFAVRAAQAVYVGDAHSHWWAVLTAE